MFVSGISMGMSDKHNNNSSPLYMAFTKRGAMYCLSLIIRKWANYSTKNTCHTNEQFLQFRKKYSDIKYNAHCRVHDFLDFYLKTSKTFKRSSLKQK